MVSRTLRFNLYLLAMVTLSLVLGCRTPEQIKERKRQKQLATLRVYLEVTRGHPGQNLQVTVLRASPIQLNVERGPFLNEIHVASAEVVDTPGGFRLVVHLNRQGKWLLEQYTAANSNRRLAIRSQWGVAPDVQDRYIAAPLVHTEIKDGILAFTPDASRDEAEQIAIGLNNFAGDTLLKERTDSPPNAGGTK